MGAERAISVSAIGRLGNEASPWFGIASSAEGHRLVFGEADGRVISPAADASRTTRDLLLALAAYFEGEAGEPPPDLEATQSDAAAVLRWLVATAGGDTPLVRTGSLHRALDAIDDGMPPDVVVGLLYEAMGAVSLGERPRPGISSLEELLERYRSIQR